MQAILTKFLPPTRHYGKRVKAYCQASSVIWGWDYEHNVEENHRRAAQHLARSLNWAGHWVGGALPNGTGYCYTLSRPEHSGFVVLPDLHRERAPDRHTG